MISFGGNKYTDPNEYFYARSKASLGYGSPYAEDKVINEVASTLDAEKAVVLLGFGRAWIQFLSIQANLNRRRLGSKIHTSLSEQMNKTGGVSDQLWDFIFTSGDMWPNIRYKNLRHLAAMVADTIDHNVDFNPSKELAQIIDTCKGVA